MPRGRETCRVVMQPSNAQAPTKTKLTSCPSFYTDMGLVLVEDLRSEIDNQGSVGRFSRGLQAWYTDGSIVRTFALICWTTEKYQWFRQGQDYTLHTLDLV